MKPGDPKVLRQKRSATAALKREIHLRFGWLDGAPAIAPGSKIPADGEIPWLRFNEGKRFSPHLTTVSAADVLKSIRSPSYLRRTFPRAFPRMVKNVADWSASHTVIPNLLKEARKVPDPLLTFVPESSLARKRAELVCDEFPGLGPLVGALLWRLPHDQCAVVADLKLLTKIAPHLHPILPAITELSKARNWNELEVLVRLLHLGSHLSPAAMIELLKLLAHPAMQAPVGCESAFPFEAISDFARSTEVSPKNLLSDPDPSETHFRSVLKFALQLVEMDKSDARFCIRLFLDCFPGPLLKPLAAWRARWCDLRPHLEHLCHRPEHFTRRERLALAKRCDRLKNSVVRFPEVGDPILSVRNGPSAPLVRRLVRVMPEVLEKRACRTELVRYFSTSRISGVSQAVISEMVRHFSMHPPSKLRDLGPWAGWFRREASWNHFEAEVGAVLRNRSELRMYFEALRLVIEKVEGDTGDLDSLPGLVAATADPAQAAEYCLAVEKEGLDCGGSQDATYIAAAVDRSSDARSFVQSLKSLFGLQDVLDYDHQLKGLEILDALRVASESALCVKLLDENGYRTLVHLSRVCSVLGGAVPPLPRPTARRARWMDRYPADFLPLLRALRSYLPAAEAKKRVAAILGKDFPDRGALQHELEHLERLLDETPSAGLEARAKNLRRWIDSPPEVSPARLQRLGEKLDRAASESRLDRWKAMVFEIATEKLSAKLSKFPDLDRWMADPKRARHVLGVAALTSAERRHPLRVLRAIQDPERPDDFRDHPANQEFRKLLEAKGLDLTAWVDGIGVRSFALDDGSELQLALEDDPLEILDMGHHFSTCLSPMGCNYYSVYANISDLNKRVVYGRVGGKVKARCLLALCEEGTVLVFHPYSHGFGEKFEEIITGFAESLAAAMGTVVTPRGTVPTLVGKDWYDDGSIDVGRRFGFLREGSEFRNKLKKMAPENLRPRLFEEIENLDALTIPYLIHLPEFDQRHELLAPLIPEIRLAERHLPKRTLLRAAELADRAGESVFAQEIIQRHAQKFLLRERDLLANWATLWLLVKFEPSTALQVIKKLRRKGVRSWEQDNDASVIAAAEAYYLLKRPKLAKRLFGLVKPRELVDGIKQHILARREMLK